MLLAEGEPREEEEPSEQRQPFRLWEPKVIYATVGLIAAAAFLLGGSFGNFFRDSAVTLAIAGGITGIFISSVVDAVRDRLVRADEARIDQEIEAVKHAGINDPAELERRVRASSVAKKRQGLAEQRLRRSLVDDSELKRQATAKILGYLPPQPRSAKRMLNHLRVLLVVAYEREMLGGSPPLTAEHLGKWVVLTERWPDLARLLKLQPDWLRDLENKSFEADESLANAGIGELASPELERFLGEEPALGGVLERLVHLRPAQSRNQAARPPPVPLERCSRG
jgi:hypothetical protein